MARITTLTVTNGRYLFEDSAGDPVEIFNVVDSWVKYAASNSSGLNGATIFEGAQTKFVENKLWLSPALLTALGYTDADDFITQFETYRSSIVSGGGGGGGTVTSVNGDTGPAVVLDGSEIDSTHTAANYTAGAADIDSHLSGIDTALGAVTDKHSEVVADITARDALTPATGWEAYVVDASADATVDSGAALYVYDGAAWQKIAEFESLDLTLPTAADAIPPASDDATGSVGTTTTEFALEDHKHPAQGVSADANQLLVVGADGLHHLSAGAVDSDSGLGLLTNDMGQVSQDAVKVVVLGAAPVDGTTTAYYVGQLFWDNVNKNLYEATAKSTDPDAAGTGSTFTQVTLGDSPYTQTFVVADWSAPAGGYRTLTITAGTHGKGTSVNGIEIFEDDGTNYDEVGVDRIRVVKASGDVELRIVDGEEFDGKVVIS